MLSTDMENYLSELTSEIGHFSVILYRKNICQSLVLRLTRHDINMLMLLVDFHTALYQNNLISCLVNVNVHIHAHVHVHVHDAWTRTQTFTDLNDDYL